MFLQFRFKHFSNHWIFVGVIDHVAAVSKADRIQAMRAAASGHSLDPILAADPGGCHVLGRRSAGVEMLMKPAVGRQNSVPSCQSTRICLGALEYCGTSVHIRL